MGAVAGIAVSAIGGAIGGGAGGMLGGLLGGGGFMSGIGQLVSSFLGGGGAEGIGKALAGFSPANILNAVSNLFNSISGNGVKEACNTLCKEHGMPKFIQDAVNKAVDAAMKKNEKPTEGDVQSKLNDATKTDAEKEIQELAKKMVDLVLKQLGEEGKESAGTGKAGGKKPAMSWLQAIAKAMGDTLGAKAAKMTELSQKVSDAADAQKEAGDDKEAQQAAAADMTSAQTELNGVTQEFKLMTEAFNTALKTLGDSLSSLGRRQ